MTWMFPGSFYASHNGFKGSTWIRWPASCSVADTIVSNRPLFCAPMERSQKHRVFRGLLIWKTQFHAVMYAFRAYNTMNKTYSLFCKRRRLLRKQFFTSISVRKASSTSLHCINYLSLSSHLVFCLDSDSKWEHVFVLSRCKLVPEPANRCFVSANSWSLAFWTNKCDKWLLRCRLPWTIIRE